MFLSQLTINRVKEKLFWGQFLLPGTKLSFSKAKHSTRGHYEALWGPLKPSEPSSTTFGEQLVLYWRQIVVLFSLKIHTKYRTWPLLQGAPYCAAAPLSYPLPPCDILLARSSLQNDFFLSLSPRRAFTYLIKINGRSHASTSTWLKDLPSSRDVVNYHAGLIHVDLFCAPAKILQTPWHTPMASAFAWQPPTYPWLANAFNITCKRGPYLLIPILKLLCTCLG